MNKVLTSGRATILVFGVLALLSVFGAVGGRLFSASPSYAQINLTGTWQVSGATTTGASFFCIMNLVHDVSFTPTPAPTPPSRHQRRQHRPRHRQLLLRRPVPHPGPRRVTLAKAALTREGAGRAPAFSSTTFISAC